MAISDSIGEYIRLARSGDFPMCREQTALWAHIERCFAQEDIHVHEQQLNRYLGFQKYFPFALLPWEKFVFTLHNCVYKPDGQLRWPFLFALVGRGAGKNGYAAFESFCWITPVNGIKNYDVDIFATSEAQARRSPDDIREVLEAHRGDLERYFYWNKEEIINKKTGSCIRYRTSNFKTKDGGRPGAVIFDEVHAYENYKVLDVATTGLGKKALPRRTVITTDGYVRGGPLDDYKEQSEDILFRDVPDNGFLPFICKLDSRDEVGKPENWGKANPSFFYFPTLRQQIEQEYREYQKNPTAASSFVCKRMNLPVTKEEDDVADWEDVKAANRPLPDLTGCACVAGIDYADTNDFVAAGLLFKQDGILYWISKTWVCRASADLARIKAPLEEWATKGLLEYVEGPQISPDLPAAWLEEMAGTYQITTLGMDTFRYTLLRAALRERGFDTDKGGRNNILLTKRVTQMRWAPVINSLFVGRQIVWGDNPLMNWYTHNTYVETDRAGNMVYMKKEEKSRKTDGFMALVHAICASENLYDSGAGSGDYQEVQVYSY